MTPYFLPNPDNTGDLIIVFIVALIIILLVLLGAFAVANTRDNRNLMLIRNQSNSIRVYIIDMNKNEVRHFNQSDLRKQELKSVEDFYQKFVETDRKKVEEWIKAILKDTSDVPHYLEADVKINRDKKSYFSLLELKKADTRQQIIHLESYILRYSLPKSRRARKGNSLVATEEQIQTILADSRNKQKGATYVLRFFPVKRKGTPTKEISNIFMPQLKDRIFPFLSPTRYLVEVTDNEFAIVDTKASSSNACMQLAHSIARSISRYLDINAIREDFGFVVGICENKYFPGDFSKLYKTARIMSLVSQNRSVRVSLYDKTVSLTEFKTDSFNEEIDLMIAENRFEYMFRPILDVRNISTFGYFSYVKAKSTVFTNVNEAKTYARTSKFNQDKDLFAAIASNIIPSFVSQRDGEHLKLFFNMFMAERVFIPDVLNVIPRVNEANLVLTFDEQDIHTFTVENAQIIPELLKLKENGYELALTLNNKDLLLSSEIYSTFDYFIVDGRMTKDIDRNNRRRQFLYTLCEKLVRYKKPIIATDLDNWNSIELMTKSGINMLSSNVISESDEMVLPFDRKKIPKIKSFNVANRA